MGLEALLLAIARLLVVVMLLLAMARLLVVVILLLAMARLLVVVMVVCTRLCASNKLDVLKETCCQETWAAWTELA
jgi:hypothetical protein